MKDYKSISKAKRYNYLFKRPVTIIEDSFFICCLLQFGLGDMYNESWSLYRYVPSKMSEEDWILIRVDIYLYVWYSWVLIN